MNLTNLFLIVEKNPRLKEIYAEKMTEYMNRAEQIKKALNETKSGEATNTGGGAAQATK